MGKYAEAYAKAKAAGGLTDVEPEWFNFAKKGQSIVGKLIGVQEQPSLKYNQTFRIYLMETDNGPVRFKLSSAADTQVGAFLKIGAVYRVEYTGTEDIGKANPVKTYKVECVIDIVVAENGEPIPF